MLSYPVHISTIRITFWYNKILFAPSYHSCAMYFLFQLPVSESSPKSKPRYEGTSPSGPIKQVPEEGGSSKLRQKPPLFYMARRSSLLVQAKPSGFDIPNPVSNGTKLTQCESSHEPEAPNPISTGVKQALIDPIQVSTKIPVELRVKQLDASNSKPLKKPLQSSEEHCKVVPSTTLKDHNDTVAVNLIDNHRERDTCSNYSEPDPPSSTASYKHTTSYENLSVASHGPDYRSVSCAVESSEIIDDLHDSLLPSNHEVSSKPDQELPFPIVKQECICKDDSSVSGPFRSDLMLESSLSSAHPGDDKFTVREFLSSVTDVTSTAVSNTPRNLPQEKGPTLPSHMVEKPMAAHLTPVFDDVIHVIRHSSFRVGSEQPVMETVEMGVQNMDVGKLLNVVREEADIRNVAPVAVKPSNCSEAVAVKSNFSETLSDKDMDVRNTTPRSPRLSCSDAVKSNSSEATSGPKEEESSTQETLDVKSSRQRAEALEGLLELSADLLQQNRLEELSVVLKPFGKDKVSPRETAIWLAKSLKGMMIEDAGRSA